MAINAVQFDAGRPINPVNGVSFDGLGDGAPVAINPGQLAPVNPPVVNPVVNNDGLRAQHVVPVRLPSRNGPNGFETFYLYSSRVHSNGSEERLDAEFDYAELLRVAARCEALALRGLLCGRADFSDINTIKLNLHRQDRSHAFTLQRVRFTPNGGVLQEMRPDLYADFVARMQQEIADLGNTLAREDNERRGRQELLRHHGDHPAQQSARP